MAHVTHRFLFLFCGPSLSTVSYQIWRLKLASKESLLYYFSKKFPSIDCEAVCSMEPRWLKFFAVRARTLVLKVPSNISPLTKGIKGVDFLLRETQKGVRPVKWCFIIQYCL